MNPEARRMDERRQLRDSYMRQAKRNMEQAEQNKTLQRDRYIAGDRKRGPLQHVDRVVRGFTRADLARLFAEQGYTKGAEIGVADGRNSLTLCQANPRLHLLCVDPWRPYTGNRRGGPTDQHERNLALARERLAPYTVTLMRGMSTDIVDDVGIGSLDFCYVDGNHAFEFVLADLDAWHARVRSGGVVAGHDFYAFNGAGVVEAVEQFTAAHGITDWHLTDEREPSFWWVKR